MFGDKYKKDMDAVSPSAEALASTAEKMKNARRAKRTVYRRWITLAAACLLVAVGMASIFPATRFFSRDSKHEHAENDAVLGEFYGSCQPGDELYTDTPEAAPETNKGNAADYTTLCAIISDKLNEHKDIPKNEETDDEYIDTDAEENDGTRDEVQDNIALPEETISSSLASKDYDSLLSYNDILVLIYVKADTTKAEVYSASKKETLVSFTQSGEYIYGKIENGKLYLVTLDSNMPGLLGTYNNSDETIINALPYCGTDTEEIVSANRIYISDADLTFTVASCLDLESYYYDSIAVMGGGSIAYAEDGALYIYKNNEAEVYAIAAE